MTLTKEAILAEIRRVAGANGGKAPGKGAFLRATGTKESDWSGRFWVRWSDALGEAGLAANRFGRARLSDEHLLVALALLTRELGHFPTTPEMRLKARRDPTFASSNTFRRFGSKDRLIERVRRYCDEHPGYSDVVPLCPALLRPPETPAYGNASIKGYVYLMRSGRRYKIGHTTSPSRRHREVRLDLPDPTILVHTIQTDDPAGIEAYWHHRFLSRRIRDTEFFELNASEVAAFRSRKSQ